MQLRDKKITKILTTSFSRKVPQSSKTQRTAMLVFLFNQGKQLATKSLYFYNFQYPISIN